MTEDLTLAWRTNRGAHCLNDIEVLNWIDDHGPSSPRQISELRRRESEIRLQCRYLSNIGLLRLSGPETYRLAPLGTELLCGESSLPVSNGYLNLHEIVDLPQPRIADLSALSQIKIKRQNSEFYHRADNYTVDEQDIRRARRKIWGVKKWKLTRLLREFPTLEPAVAQSAHWLRTIVGLHLFPDANHRTAMATLSRLVLSNNIIDVDHPWPGEPEEIGKAVLLSKFHRHLASKVTLATLWKQDTLYWHWYQYFDYLLNGTRYAALHKHTEGSLRDKLRKVRGGGN